MPRGTWLLAGRSRAGKTNVLMQANVHLFFQSFYVSCPARLPIHVLLLLLALYGWSPQRLARLVKPGVALIPAIWAW